VKTSGQQETANCGPSQTDFAHVVSTNYSQYNMWYLQ
jgi:hypothetical protein